MPAAANCWARSPPPTIHTSFSPAASSSSARSCAGGPERKRTESATGASSAWVRTKEGCAYGHPPPATSRFSMIHA